MTTSLLKKLLLHDERVINAVINKIRASFFLELGSPYLGGKNISAIIHLTLPPPIVSMVLMFKGTKSTY